MTRWLVRCGIGACLLLGAGAAAIAWIITREVYDPTLLTRAFASEAPLELPREPRPYDPHRQLFFGDTHIHSSLSNDAYILGVRAPPEDAYIYAKGGEITHALGYPIRLSRPLDFAVLTDHSEYLGLARAAVYPFATDETPVDEIYRGKTRLAVTRHYLRTVLSVRDDFRQGQGLDAYLEEGQTPESVMEAAWDEIVGAAETHNDPGVFTAFIGYEWSGYIGWSHLHRNVVFRGTAIPDLPFSATGSDDPKDLWEVMAEWREQGIEAFAIPHNANLSNGNQYPGYEGKPLSAERAALRAEFEPLSEIYQVKGSSDAHPDLSPNDPFADFETYDVVLDGTNVQSQNLEGNYIRSALLRGLKLERELGVNPYRHGLIGASDGHNASSPVEEDRYHGKLPVQDGAPSFRLNQVSLLPASYNVGARWGSGGLAGVWAEENTRASLFDAMKRRETFATSGTRISVRVFAGWAFDRDAAAADGFAERGYAGGAPMGGSLPPRPVGAGPPRFAIRAEKDPSGANLDRVQIIKGWLDPETGETREKVFDALWSGPRRMSPETGFIPAIGSTVDVAAATYENSIGAETLAGVWEDPEFDPAAAAFYSVRVLEIPTPRWSTYDAARLGVPAPDPAEIQERATTSPIYYDLPAN